ncbi:hypothetical protein FA13DRAFT_1287205 [Coprinellus micaceus]|uniref:F-box domain-containing protein n=1 Tax=Coprinellus micaceus TaxID=71717 RepID=A0A4Y7SSL6_COPMI|nr:hypothetical protein FA13DRAFT_1287205 [Coprinellus micaceus]
MSSIVRSTPRSIAQADVPSDVWLGIIVHLEALDVLLLQSLLYDTLHDRSVWTSVLQRGCSRDGVYFPSYPVDEMDVKRLQRAALGPYRLYKLVESCSAHSSNPPPLAHASSTRLTTPIVQLAETEATFLVPGGRYLLVGDIVALSLWDLGPPDFSASCEPLLVARTAIPSHHVLQNDWRPQLSVRARADDTLQVALAVGNVLLSVYHINPSQPSPSFRCIATLPVDFTSHPGLDSASRALSSSDDVVLLALGAACGSFVWNFREGWYGFGPRRSELFWVGNNVSHHE